MVLALNGKFSVPYTVSVSYAATITPNADDGEVQNIGTLTGALTMNPPSGTPRDGQNLRFRFVQDGTGRAITFSTAANGYAFGTDITAAMVPATASAKFEMLFTWNATDSKWRCTALVRGF